MNHRFTNSKNWFEQGGQDYARFRPHYPAELAAYLASISPDTDLAVDVGCGSGQLTAQLADHFSTVIGFDPSSSQLVHAKSRPNISYRCASAEDLPLPEQCVSLVCAAQAAHWFDLPNFYANVRRIARPGAVLALISYGVLQLDIELEDRFQQFYRNEIGPYWPAERQLVDSGYSTLHFPFEPIQPPAMAIRLEWTLEAFLGYLSTWSSVQKARELGQTVIMQTFAHDLASLWGDAGRKRPISWPINMRLGRI